MDIEDLIKKEAPNDDEHDRIYAKALRMVYDVYSCLDLDMLKDYLKQAKNIYRNTGPTHHVVASCVVLTKLIEEKEGE